MKNFLSKLKKLSLAVSLLPEAPSCPTPTDPHARSWACAEIGDIARILNHILTELILPLAGGVALIFLIWGGIQYLTAYGNEERAKKGKTIIIWTIVGIVIIILSRIIVGEITSLLTPNRLTPSPITPNPV